MGPLAALSRQLCRISTILPSGRSCYFSTRSEAHSSKVWAIARGQTSCTPASPLHRAACRTGAACGHPEAFLATSAQSTAAIAAALGLLPAPSEPQRLAHSSAAMPAPPSPQPPREEPAQTEHVPPDTVPAVLRALHWITAQRGRSFEDRGLRVRVKVNAAACCLMAGLAMRQG